MKEVAMCPRGHGPLRRDREGYASCIECGYEEPLEPMAKYGRKTDRGGNLNGEIANKIDPGSKPGYGHDRGYRYPEDIKRQAVRDIERGIDKEEVCKRVYCQLSTLYQWIEKYGGKSKVAANLKALKEMLTELRRSRFDLLRDASVLHSRIETIEEAINILEEAKEK